MALFGTLIGRCIAHIQSGCLGLVPAESLETDRIAVFNGVPAPFILRKHGSGYQVVGTCYIHGLMDGEAYQRGLPEEDIILL